MRIIKFDWLLGAAFLAAPFYWWALLFFFGVEFEQPAPASAWKALALLVLVYPVLEEIAFRGALQSWIRRRAWGLWHRSGITSANVLTSIVFTAFHLIRRPDVWSAGVFVPSLVFGFFRDRYDNLYACIALHIFYNSGPLWLLIF